MVIYLFIAEFDGLPGQICYIKKRQTPFYGPQLFYNQTEQQLISLITSPLSIYGIANQ